MCIFFLSTDCPFAGLEPTMPLPILFKSSRRPSTDEATSSNRSIMSSRSSITTMSSYSRGSSDSLNEMLKASISERPVKHFRIPSLSEAEPAFATTTAEDSAASDYITAINTLTNSLENHPSNQIGRCVGPTSPVPSQCKNFQIRHRSSYNRQTGYFDRCSKCTDVGKQWQESRVEEGATWEELRAASSRGQKVRKAETGMCSTSGCVDCRPSKN